MHACSFNFIILTMGNISQNLFTASFLLQTVLFKQDMQSPVIGLFFLSGLYYIFTV